MLAPAWAFAAQIGEPAEREQIAQLFVLAAQLCLSLPQAVAASETAALQRELQPLVLQRVLKLSWTAVRNCSTSKPWLRAETARVVR